MSEEEAPETTIHQTLFEIDYPKKRIRCGLTSQSQSSESTEPQLIFTHGAGGTLDSPAIANFVHGFASHGSTILCFQGTMNLQSRVKMFEAVTESQHFSKCIGGRSMGARAAVKAATEDTTHLVLVSYPLHTDKDTRDDILLDIPETTSVLFVNGDGDAMCYTDRLDAVRKKMKCPTWRVVVEGADHGMVVKPRAGTIAIGQKTGEIVAQWLQSKPTVKDQRTSKIVWDADNSQAQWTGWVNST